MKSRKDGFLGTDEWSLLSPIRLRVVRSIELELSLSAVE